MSASEIQKQRMADYFKEAAKEILRGEGIKAASARNIAERAGYSYATLYNYFDDLPALIFECVKDFQAEIEELITAAVKACSTADTKLRTGLGAWVNYFVQYPGIFELFFLEPLGGPGCRKEAADTIYNSIVPAIRPALESAVSEGRLTQQEAETKEEALRYQATGLLLYYTNRRTPADYNGLLQALNRLIDG